MVIIDNLSTGHLAAVHPAATFILGDLCNVDLIERTFITHPGINAVLHFASLPDPGESMRQPDRYLAENLVNGVNLISSAARQ